MRTKVVFLNLGILFVSCLLAVVLAEFIARRVVGLAESPPYYVGEFQNRPSRNFVIDRHTGWRMAKDRTFRWKIGLDEKLNTYTSNLDGFRSDKEFNGDGSIVLIGDSFTFGTGVSYANTFGALLENDLGNLPVYNLAMPGFGIDQMWMALKHQAANYDPKLLIVAFVDKDLDRSLTAFRKAEGMNKPAFLFEGGNLRLSTAEDQPPELIRQIDRRLALAGMLRENLRNLGYTLPLGTWWTLNAEIFTQMIRDAESVDVPLLFIRLPFRGARTFPTLTSFMDSEGANFLDVETLSNKFEDEAIFIPGDNHINEAGHQIVAEAVRQWVDGNLPIL
jgi:hypothetical protein